MVIIGVTGGIGSGKSTVCRLFAERGVPVFLADAQAKEILQSTAAAEVLAVFGPEVAGKEERIDRKALAALVFSDPEALDRLNAIIHPKVFDRFRSWKEALPSGTRYAIAEAALMFESGMFEMMDYTLAVITDDAIRLQRTVTRDGATETEVKARMEHQLPLEHLLELSDFQIRNNGTPADLSSKVSFFHTIFPTLKPPAADDL